MIDLLSKIEWGISNETDPYLMGLEKQEDIEDVITFIYAKDASRKASKRND